MPGISCGSKRRAPFVRRSDASPPTSGSVMTVEVELDGQMLVALNGGPDFTFNEAVSFQVNSEDQKSTSTGSGLPRAEKRVLAADTRKAQRAFAASSR